jgi:outer membrane protein assembly factor BamB
VTAHTTRRGYLAATAAAVGLAGCASLPGTSDDGADAAALPEDLVTTAPATFRGDLRRTGHVPDRSVPDGVAVDWYVPGVNVGNHTAAKASAVRTPDGTYVVPGDSGEVHAVAPGGSVEWVAPTLPSAFGIHGTPTVANGLVYVGAYDGALYAFDLATGERVWRTPLGDAIGSSPAYHDGVVYIAVEYDDPDGSVFGVDARTGAVAWEDDRPTDHPHSTIAIDREAGRLVVGSNDGTLYGWSYPDRERAWTFDTAGAIKGPIATHDGGAFFGSWDGRIYRVSLDDGTEDWSYDTGNLVMGGAGIDTDAGVVYVGGHDGVLHAFDAASGDRRWGYGTGGRITGCPTVAGDGLLVGSYDGLLHAVNPDGSRRWTESVGAGWVTCEPYLDADGVVVTARAKGTTSGPAVRFAGT